MTTDVLVNGQGIGCGHIVAVVGEPLEANATLSMTHAPAEPGRHEIGIGIGMVELHVFPRELFELPRLAQKVPTSSGPRDPIVSISSHNDRSMRDRLLVVRSVCAHGAHNGYGVDALAGVNLANYGA